VPADDLSDPAVQMIQRELDSIIVLSRAIAEQGTHRQLLDLGGLYAEMYYNQQKHEKNVAP